MPQRKRTRIYIGASAVAVVITIFGFVTGIQSLPPIFLNNGETDVSVTQSPQPLEESFSPGEEPLDPSATELSSPGAPTAPLDDESASASSDTQYLSDMEPVDTTGVGWRDAAEINGTRYVQSLHFNVGRCGSSVARTISYNLEREWEKLSTVAGVDDENEYQQSVVRFEVHLDGKLLGRKDVPFGKTETFDLDVSDGLRLELRGISLKHYSCQDGGAAWGDPMLSR